MKCHTCGRKCSKRSAISFLIDWKKHGKRVAVCSTTCANKAQEAQEGERAAAARSYADWSAYANAFALRHARNLKPPSSG